MTITALKIIALVTMTIDHIGEFIPGIPVWFRWIGRVSAPVFMFCMAEAMHHTGNRRKYVLRLYAMVWVTAVIEFAATVIYAYISDGNYVYISNHIFTTLVNAAVIIMIIEELVQKKKVTYKIWLYLLWQVIIYVLAYFLFDVGYGFISNYKCLLMLCRYLVYNASCSILFSEGGMAWILLGVLFYYGKEKIRYLYPAYVCVYSLMDIYCIPARIAVRLEYYKLDILYDIVKICAAMFQYDVRFIYEPSLMRNYQWMMIFSMPILMLYNGKYGKGIKKLFYIYYPAHIVILFFIGKLF